MQDLLDSQKKLAEEIMEPHALPQGSGPTSLFADERKNTAQKRTFTRWMNVFLRRRDPPLEVGDLFTDIQDGRVLMALLEELSGCKLLYRFRSSSHRIFRLSNISKALTFLDDRHVKLFGIDACGIADGVPSVVLKLIWNIILHFQVKEAVGGLQRRLSSSVSSLSWSSCSSTSDLSPSDLSQNNNNYACNTLPRNGKKNTRKSKYHSKAIRTLLQWVQRTTSKYGVDVEDFGASWRSGLAFLALIKSIDPDVVNLRDSLSREPKENICQAFLIAQQCWDVPALLEPEDVSCTSPNQQSIITYVSMFLEHTSGTDEEIREQSDFPEIPNFGTFGPVTAGETFANDPEAHALLQSFEKSNEHVLWRQWSRRSSEAIRGINRANASERLCSSSQRALPPPSPLKAGVVNQEIRAWMDTGLDWGYRKSRGCRSVPSQGSDEGVYSFTVLDSDEEDAYSYILDLNKEVFQQVPKVEEETAEEMKAESEHHNGLGMLHGGCRQQESAFGQCTDQLEVHTKFDLDSNNRCLRATVQKGDVFDRESDDKISDEEESEDEKATNNHQEWKEKTENTREMNDGCIKTVAGAKARKDVEEEIEREAANKQRSVSEKKTAGRDLTGLDEKQDLKQHHQRKEAYLKKETGRRLECSNIAARDENFSHHDVIQSRPQRNSLGEESDRTDHAKTDLPEGCQIEVGHLMKSSDDISRSNTMNQVPRSAALEGPIITAHDANKDPTKINHEDIQDDDFRQTPQRKTHAQSFSNEEHLLQSVAAYVNISPFELEILLGLWILLYCFFILFETKT